MKRVASPCPVQAGQVLFVYGTLRPGAAHPMGRFLQRHATCLGRGVWRGRIYRLGLYPGAVAGGTPHDRVIGDLYRLPPGARWLMTRLDDYEGAAFIRSRTRVVAATGRRVAAWIYVLRQGRRRRSPIAGGDWVADRGDA